MPFSIIFRTGATPDPSRRLLQGYGQRGRPVAQSRDIVVVEPDRVGRLERSKEIKASKC